MKIEQRGETEIWGGKKCVVMFPRKVLDLVKHSTNTSCDGLPKNTVSDEYKAVTDEW